MSNQTSPGARFRSAVARGNPLQCIGAINAYHARLAAASGCEALYVSGGGVAAGSCGIPDLGITTAEDVLIDVRRITDVVDLPVLVDIDTGWGGAFNIARTIRAMEKAGAAAVHLEDQVQQKRCGHRPNKAIVPQTEMVDRIKAAVDARRGDDFVVMARTDALAVEGMEAALERAVACVEAGADMLFPEAVTTLAQYRAFVEAVKVPVLANITEFGSTPLFTLDELRSAGIRIALYPLSAFRAANAAALKVYQTIIAEGTQRNVLDLMQTREELYSYLGYHDFEQTLDRLFSAGRNGVGTTTQHDAGGDNG
ncbi:methylisocitrate lyase [Acidihalobacter ferrooxydans]|uniref:methylisocitrate lyase n=1 Tax=Acidihalobacter ferrooxydans TaxID=1765967 RepID=UPI0018DC4E70|nr:methylisocitrate lyase [Acidihalobacter ferrooxydans]